MASKSLFLKLFGDSPILKVLDFFMVYEDFDYSMVDIARNSEVGYSTLKLFWRDLIKYKLVEQTRIIGKAKLFRLNKKNLIVNIGTGKGHTVFEVIAAASKVTGKNIDYEIVKRRAGDPEELYACSDFANKILGWEPKYSDLETIFKSMMPVYL